MKRTSPLFATSCLAASIALASCGGAGSAPGGGSQLIVARVQDAVGLDPAVQTDGNSLVIAQEVFRNLVRFAPGSFDVIPDIAKSWKITPDGKTWTFALESGLKFSDGTPLDATAVKFNFDRWRDTKNAYRGQFPFAYYSDMLGGFDAKSLITGVDAPGPTTVVLHLKNAFTPLLRDLALPSLAVGSPTAIMAGAEAFNQSPVGSGPYVVSEWVHDDHITLSASPTWTGPKPAYSTVIVRDIPDQSTSVLSMQKGDVDMLIDPRPDDAKTLGAQAGISLYHPASNDLMYLAMNMTKKPFDNLDVRRAIAFAIDKEAIVKRFYAEGATVADNWTPVGMEGENPAVKAYPHDVAKAKALLAKAGLAHFATELYYPTTPRPYMPEPQRVAETIQADLAAVGIDVTLQPFEFGVFLHKVQNGEHPMCLIGWTGDNGDPDDFTYPMLDQDSAVLGTAQNYSFWRDPAFHKLMLAGQQTPEGPARAAIYARVNAMIADQVPAVSISHSVVSFAAKTSIAGVTANPDVSFNFIGMKPKGTQ